jgi:1-deoxy-D-xylulose-5-phosphate reductoisomerase
MKAGESMPAVLNAANEVAVEAFLKGKIRFIDIPVVIEKTMNAHVPQHIASIEEVLFVDRWGREKGREIIGETRWQ